MKMFAATVSLVIIFLSAGAFANNNQAPIQAATPVNVTVIAKNQVWPVIANTLFTNCKVNRCIDI